MGVSTGSGPLRHRHGSILAQTAWTLPVVSVLAFTLIFHASAPTASLIRTSNSPLSEYPPPVTTSPLLHLTVSSPSLVACTVRLPGTSVTFRTPVEPVGPATPVLPVAPVMPADPAWPVSPLIPCGPVTPFDPCGPDSPLGPVAPAGSWPALKSFASSVP